MNKKIVMAIAIPLIILGLVFAAQSLVLYNANIQLENNFNEKQKHIESSIIEVVVNYQAEYVYSAEIRVDGEYYCSATTGYKGHETYMIDKNKLSGKKECYNISLVYPDLDEITSKYVCEAKCVKSYVKFSVFYNPWGSGIRAVDFNNRLDEKN